MYRHVYRKLPAAAALVVFAACQDSPTAVVPTPLLEGFGISQAQHVDELPQIPAHAVNGQVVSGQYIVVLKGNTADVTSNARRLAVEHGARLGYVYEAALKGFSGRMSAAAAARLARDPAVDYVEADRVVTAQSTQYLAPFGLDRIDQASLPLSKTFTYTRSGSGVRIYVLDSGTRITHLEFALAPGISRASYGYDFIDNDAVADDCGGHGTHVAGIAAGRTYGVAKNAYIRAVRVLDCTGSGTYAQIIAGVNWVTANAIRPAVANLSFYGPNDRSFKSAVANSIAQGITFVVAAGTYPVDACTMSPGSVATALTVTGSDARSDFRMLNTAYGACVDLFAPGGPIQSAWNTSDVATMSLSGTSQAAPFVTGVVAQYLQTSPTASPANVHAKILGMASLGKIKGTTLLGTPNKLLRTTL